LNPVSLAVLLLGIVVAVALVYPLVYTVSKSMEPNDAYEFIEDLWRIATIGGQVVKSYYLKCRITNGSVELQQWVWWNNTLVNHITYSKIRVKSEIKVDGFCVLKIRRSRDGYIWIERKG